jgi:DNA-binding transcriptional MerR regulator
MSERLLTARVVADMLDVCPDTVLRWTRRGLLPGIRLPSGALRYRRDDVTRWLAERETQAADGADEESHHPDAPAAETDRTTHATIAVVTTPEDEEESDAR